MIIYKQNELYHWGIKGQRWGIRRYQNEDGTLTDAGKKRYQKYEESIKEYTDVKNRILDKQVNELKDDVEFLKNNKKDYNAIRKRFSEELSYQFEDDPEYYEEKEDFAFKVDRVSESDIDSFVKTAIKDKQNDIDKYAKMAKQYDDVVQKMKSNQQYNLGQKTFTEVVNQRSDTEAGAFYASSALGAIGGAALANFIYKNDSTGTKIRKTIKYSLATAMGASLASLFVMGAGKTELEKNYDKYLKAK